MTSARYYYDVETKLYYLNSRYYDPEVGRFLSPDILSILNETMMEANGLNLYMYCGNNPVMRKDEFGRSWKSFWASIGQWFSDTFGFVANVGNEWGYEIYHFLWSTEIGVGYNKNFDNGKIINFYLNIPAQFWKIWEYSFGVDINVNGYGLGIYIGGESGISVHTPKASFDLSVNLRGQLSFKTSIVNDNGVYNYSKLSLNIIEIGGTAIGLAMLFVLNQLAGATVTAALIALLIDGNRNGEVSWKK